jgi:magnesium-transporting ATPase (P-type)
MAGVVMGICLLAFCTGMLAVGKFGINLGTEALRTLAFVVLVFGSQATLYVIRERRHLWSSRPSLWLAVSSVVDIAIASTLAVGGIAMMPLPALLVAGILAAAAVFALVLDFVKVPVFARLMRPLDNIQHIQARNVTAPDVRTATTRKLTARSVLYILCGLGFWFIALYAAIAGLTDVNGQGFVTLPCTIAAMCFAALGATSLTEAFAAPAT